MFCPDCGKRVVAGSLNCPERGGRLDELWAARPTVRPRRWAGLAIPVVLGAAIAFTVQLVANYVVVSAELGYVTDEIRSQIPYSVIS